MAQEDNMKITRITAENCFCFTTFAMDFGPNGGLIEGGNAQGKTSILNMIRAALVEKGATRDMIKKGSDKGEIIVRVDNLLVRRGMLQGDKFRTTLRVTDDMGKNVPEPASFLKNLLGLSPLDPIELFLEKDKGKRRAKILSAIPCTVTAEQLAKWCPPGSDLAALVGDDGTGTPALDDHGLDIVERARKALYARRTEANRVVKDRQLAFDQASAKEGAAYDALSAYRIENALPEKAPEFSEAINAVDAANRAIVALDEQRRTAEASARNQMRTREKIASLQQKASDMRANQPIAATDLQIANAEAETSRLQTFVSKAEAIVADLERQLVAAKQDLDVQLSGLSAAKKYEQRLAEQTARAEQAVDEIANVEGQALELEQALGALPIAPNEAAFVEADRAAKKAKALVEFARKAEELATHAEAVDKARVMLKSATEDAATLDRSVKTLADDAPSALLAAADGIKGLTIAGDDVFLDGVALDQLSGQERLFFAIEVARRLNAKSKLLCVDGLEVLDAEHRLAFVEKATEGGYQLIATRVTEAGGEPVATPIR
jgi:hypothetical protein